MSHGKITHRKPVRDFIKWLRKQKELDSFTIEYGPRRHPKVIARIGKDTIKEPIPSSPTGGSIIYDLVKKKILDFISEKGR